MEETFGQLSFSRNSRSSSSSGSVSPSVSDTSDSYSPRMASSDQLRNKQPTDTQRAKDLSANSYQNLFGAPAERSRPRARRIDRTERGPPARRSPKPLPVNTLTGAIIGLPHQNVPKAIYVPQPQNYARRSPGGTHSQLW
eukprot:GFUD01004390.1.p1 GENE.GFUD01004390.1~~GFUD01004390.1.p1  ORF type:complete len:140 (+),score=33.30 GFUD01004390.1:134-553(+)